LSATILRRRITGALRTSKDPATITAAGSVTQSTVYEYPTIEGLSSFLVALISDPEGVTDTKRGKVLIEKMIEKYSTGLDGKLPSASSRTSATSSVVLLTGSTGNLGAQILASLLENENVARIYALNRPSSSSTSMLDRHRERFADKALDASLLESDRLVFVEGDTASPNLGMSECTYEEVSQLAILLARHLHLPLASEFRFGDHP
jgi:FlaA1/EpsC-like NDP-sugar epimerase